MDNESLNALSASACLAAFSSANFLAFSSYRFLSSLFNSRHYSERKDAFYITLNIKFKKIRIRSTYTLLFPKKFTCMGFTVYQKECKSFHKCDYRLGVTAKVVCILEDYLDSIQQTEYYYYSFSYCMHCTCTSTFIISMHVNSDLSY